MEPDEVKIRKIFFWMGVKERYDNGVTNDDVMREFGSSFTSAWNKLKARKKIMFFENGRWFRWN